VIDELRRPWATSERRVPRAVVRPALRFAQVEAAGGIVMLVGAVVALVWANSGWSDSYERLWSTPLRLQLGDLVDLNLDLHAWVNDGLMTLFFLVAGLEIKRQLVTGELRDRRAALLPGLAALGGMVVPALLYVLINLGGATRGFGIPVATDIAFAVGVVSLVGKRIPSGARIFLLTLAVVDDVGGIVIIAVFYATGVKPLWLLVAAGSVALAVVARRAEIRSILPYAVCGVVCWYAFHEAGVEAAIAGVIFGLLTPARPFHDPEHFGDVARAFIDRVEHSDEQATEDLARYVRETASPLERVENSLNRWVSFVIVPLFALANAGVSISTDGLNGNVFSGVVVGLVVGKLVGVFAASWLAVKLGVGRLPHRTSWGHMAGLAATAGIGFTVALYVTGLSFDDAGLIRSAKLGILVASSIAGILGFVILRFSPESKDQPNL
jgi:Na+:H+ antiporter, NhaA family